MLQKWCFSLPREESPPYTHSMPKKTYKIAYTVEGEKLFIEVKAETYSRALAAARMAVLAMYPDDESTTVQG